MSDKETEIKPRRFGDGTPGPGRPKGVPNKSTTNVKAALEAAFEGMGGAERLMAWGQEQPGEFYKLWAKLLPTEVKASLTDGEGGPARIVVEYVTPPSSR